MRKKYLVLLFLLSISQASIAEKNNIIGDFSTGSLAGWEAHSFKGKTIYSIVQDQGVSVLKAESKNSASGLIHKKRIDLSKTPFLNWRWKVNKSLYRLTETLKKGDDFSARVYVIIDGGIFFWRTLALNYVWSSFQPIDTMWDNPFTSNAKMISLQTGNKKSQQWQSEKRNIREDLRRAYGKDIRFIDAVAVMTDTDNSGQSATAYYADIYFSEK